MNGFASGLQRADIHGMDGHEFEVFVFGSCRTYSPYCPYGDAVCPEAWSGIARDQPWANPAQPGVEFASALRSEVAGLLPGASVPRFYTLVNSPWDWHVGDGLLVWRGSIVALDATINTEKTQGSKQTKSDYLVTRLEAEFSRCRRELAAKIAAQFLAGQARTLVDLWGRQQQEALARKDRPAKPIFRRQRIAV